MPSFEYNIISNLEYCHEFDIYHRPVEWVTSSQHVLMLIASGRGTVNWKNDQKNPIRADDKQNYLFYLPPNSWRFVDVCGDQPMHIVAVRFSLFYEDGSDFFNYYTISERLFCDHKIALRRLMQEILSHIGQQGLPSYLEMERQFRILIGYFLEAAQLKPTSEFQTKPARCGKAILYLRQNYNKELDIDKLAGLCNISRPYFFALFREETGMTAEQYLRQIRLEHARKLLLLSSKSIAEIGEEVGWHDPFHFSRIFSREMGYSPSKFRQMKVT